jgi:hypothetical protein
MSFDRPPGVPFKVRINKSKFLGNLGGSWISLRLIASQNTGRARLWKLEKTS